MSAHATGAPRLLDAARDDLGGEREVEQLGQRDRVAADHQLARGEDGGGPRRVEHRGHVDVHDGAVHGPDVLGEVEVGGGHAAVGDGLGQRDVRRGDQRGRRVAVRVGEPGEQVVGGAGVGDVEVAADADGGEEGVVGWAWWGGRRRGGGRSGALPARRPRHCAPVRARAGRSRGPRGTAS